MKNRKLNKFLETFRTPALIFFGSLAILFFVSFASNSFKLDDHLAGILESGSSAVGAAAVFGAAYFAYQELDEVSKSRHIDVADRLFDELNSPDIIEARRIIYQNLNENPETGLSNLSDESRDAMKDVLNSLDRVAFLTQPGWIPDELVMPWMHPMIAKSWEKLEPYVMYERKRRNEPYYYEHAGELADRCRKWRAKHLAETSTKWTDDAL
jgi:hypothetical protein